MWLFQKDTQSVVPNVSKFLRQEKEISPAKGPDILLGLEVKAGTVGFGNQKTYFPRYILGMKLEGKRIEKSKLYTHSLKRHGWTR